MANNGKYVEGFGFVQSGLPVDNSNRPVFKQDDFDRAFGGRTIRMGIPASDGPGVYIKDVNVADHYGKLIAATQEAEKSGNPERYYGAVYDLATFVGKEMDEQTRGGSNDMLRTQNAAARNLRDMSYNDYTQGLITTGQDWTATSDTLTNQGWAHPVDDVINSESFGGLACELINFRGCGFVSAQLVNSEYNPRGRQNSPKMVEVRVKGFKKVEEPKKQDFQIPANWTKLS